MSATNQVRKLKTDVKGEFIAPNLPPGVYEVTISEEGFRKLRQTGLELALDQEARMSFHLQMGAVTESVQVVASSVPLINTENSVKGDVVARQELIEMPLNGRDFTDLAMLTAGVNPNKQPNSGSGMAINGARADNTNFLVDGFNNQNPQNASPQAAPNLDAMQEFKIQTSNYSAELGRLAGGVMNVVLKSGGNRLHGSLFEFLRNDHVDARNFFDDSKSELRRNQFGGEVDGPVVIPKLYNGRDRTFFLVSWESYRQRQGAARLQVVPTEAVRNGDFSGLSLIKDPLSTGTCNAKSAAACFPGNQIPKSRMSATALNIGSYYPLPNRTGVNNYYANPKAQGDWDSYVFKVDQHISSSDTVSIRYLTRNNNAGGPTAAALPVFLASTQSGQKMAGLTYTKLFGPTLINEARVGVNRTTTMGSGNHQDTDYNARFGLPGPSDPSLIGFPIVNITNYASLGDASSMPSRSAVTNYTFGDTLTWVKGSHVIKAGGEILRFQWNSQRVLNLRGTFAFTGYWTGQPYADFLLGYLNSSTRTISAPMNYMRSTNKSVFIQDDWKATSRLTLNLGLRYELPGPATQTNGHWASYMPEYGKYVYSEDPSLDSPGTVFSDPSRIATAGQLGLPNSLVYARHDDLAPRFGFAYRPFGNNRTVIRGGYGIFFGTQLMANVMNYMNAVFPYVTTQVNNRNATNPQYLTLANSFPVAPSMTGNLSTLAVSGWELHAPTPTLQSWNFTVEHEIGMQAAVEVSYTGSKGTHLNRVYNINQPFRSAATYPTFPVPYAGWSTIQYIGFGFDSSYNAASITLRRRFARNFFYRLSYTYSKSIDNASQMGVTNNISAAGTGGIQDVRNFSLERGRSDFDTPHSFTMTFSWQTPFKRNAVLKGWQLAGTGILRSGQPFTPMVNNVNFNLGEAVRPNRIAKGTVSNPSPDNWFDVSAFPVVPSGSYSFGTSGRDILDGPGMIQVNLSLIRNFRLGEKSNLQVRCETFNALNHANFNDPVNMVNMPNAGTITSAMDPRLVQFGLRFSF